MPDHVRLPVTAVRHARAEDMPALAIIEGAADEMFADVMDVSVWPAPTSGEDRAGEPGWLLVVGDPPLGFAHLLELDGGVHLEQLAVHPSAQRQGLGETLLRAACGVALDAGYDALTLMTYADVPWNGPWYARHGFTEITRTSDPALWGRLVPVRASEDRLGLARGGRRIGMTRHLTDEPTPIPAVSVIPVRDGAAGLEVFVQHRAATMDFVPGAVVFPGGRVDPVDRVSARARLARGGGVTTDAARWARTAYDALGSTPVEAAQVLRETGVRELLEECGVTVPPGELLPWDNWVTPIGAPKRFDVHFFVLPVGPGTELVHSTTEATHSEWLTVDELVRRAIAGEVVMVAPTLTIVDELQALASVSAIATLDPPISAIRHDLLTIERPRR